MIIAMFLKTLSEINLIILICVFCSILETVCFSEKIQRYSSSTTSGPTKHRSTTSTTSRITRLSITKKLTKTHRNSINAASNLTIFKNNYNRIHKISNQFDQNRSNIKLSKSYTESYTYKYKPIDVNRVSIKDRWFVDSSGRVVFFHGFNAVNKGFPWYSSELLNTTRLQYYKEWGFNVVRLGSMWTGAQPSGPNVFNETYISILNKTLNLLNKYGIYAILDMHQDVLSSKFHAYDGVPYWLVKNLPDSFFKYPWPFRNSKFTNWAEGYLTDAVSNAFQSIYDNKYNSVDYLIKFWRKIALSFVHNPNILGYELINEPWAGDIYSNPLLLLPGEAGRRNLKPMYDRIVREGIRQVDNRTIVFYEPVTWGYVLNGKLVGSGFDSVPGGSIYNNRSAFSYHYYCWILTASEANRTYSKVKRDICDKVLGPKLMATVVEDVKKIGGSMFLTEFGICETDKPNTTQTIECEFVMDLADANLQSWTYWDSNFFYPNGNVRWSVARGFSRPYPRAVAGIPIAFSFNKKTLHFSMTFSINIDIKEPTVIFIPRLIYGVQFNVKVSPTINYIYRKSESLLYLTQTKHTVQGQTVFLKILPF